MKICPKCQKENPEDARYCNYCSYPLEIQEPYQVQNPKKIIIMGYIASIILGWIGVILTILAHGNPRMFIGFFGIILPIGFLKSQNPEIRKHAIIQTIIYLAGLITQVSLMLHLF